MSGKDAIKYKKTIYVLLLIFILLTGAIAILVFKRKTEPALGDKTADLQSSSPTVAVSPNIAPVISEPEEEIITASPAPKWQSFAYPPLKGELNHSEDEDYRYSSENGAMDIKLWGTEDLEDYETRPLLLCLHGSLLSGLEDGATLAARQYNEAVGQGLVSGDKFIILAPLNSADDGKYNTQLDLLKDLTDHIAAVYHCDLERIYIAGNSNGAEGAVKALNEYGDYFAAAVLFDGMYTIGKRAAEVPVYEISAYYDSDVRANYNDLIWLNGTAFYTDLSPGTSLWQDHTVENYWKLFSIEKNEYTLYSEAPDASGFERNGLLFWLLQYKKEVLS